MLKGLLVMTLALLTATAALAAEPARLIPMRDFFRNPDQTAFRISPDGQKIAWLAPWKERMNVFVRAIDGTEAVRLTSAEDRDIPYHFWSGSERIVFLQDQGGNEDFHLFAANIDGQDKARELTPFDKVRVGIIDDLEDDDLHLLISMNRRDPRIFDVFRLNVDSGTLEVVAENPGTVQGWITDHDGRLRAAMTSDGVTSSLLYRETEADTFEVLMTTDFKDQFSPLMFTFDNQDLYVSSNLERDKSAIFRWDPRKKEIKELIFEHPEVDVSHLISSRKRKVITGASFTTDKRHYKFFDEDRQKLQETLDKRFPGLEVAVSGMSRDERKVTVRTYSDRTLGSAYFYDRDADTLVKLAEISPWLKLEEMAEQKPITYQSRDGLTIHGYLTLPVGAEAKNLPVVINPHGGPWHRDSWGFDPQVQFLANRGYAVLQMNFRGSTGYGRAFWTASFKEWGKSMQNDITDSVKWIVDQGIADPKRVGIYGASYGGYATLAGLAFTPELYACGVDYVGVSNIFTLLETMPPYWELGRKMMYEMIGNPETEKELLTAASPLFHVDKMKAPLFVAQGANDPRVKKSESDQIVEALKKRGIDVPYMVKDNEGHGFHNEENRFDFYRAMEGFLAKHLGGREEK